MKKKKQRRAEESKVVRVRKSKIKLIELIDRLTLDELLAISPEFQKLIDLSKT